MIKLQKSKIPKVLEDNAALWTSSLMDRFSKGETPTATEKGRYAHRDIKDAIVAETHGKCAYCESKIRHVSPGDIEHIVPKKVDPARWFDWDNLTLACDVCNTNKGVKTDIVDPYESDPEERFVFLGGSIWGVPGDEEAILTGRELELNRDELFSKRIERIEYLMTLVSVIKATQSPKLRETYEQDFQKELADTAEYAALSRSVFRELQRRSIL